MGGRIRGLVGWCPCRGVGWSIRGFVLFVVTRKAMSVTRLGRIGFPDFTVVVGSTFVGLAVIFRVTFFAALFFRVPRVQNVVMVLDTFASMGRAASLAVMTFVAIIIVTIVAIFVASSRSHVRHNGEGNKESGSDNSRELHCLACMFVCLCCCLCCFCFLFALRFVRTIVWTKENTWILYA